LISKIEDKINNKNKFDEDRHKMAKIMKKFVEHEGDDEEFLSKKGLLDHVEEYDKEG